MKKIIVLFSFIIFSFTFSQNKIEKFSEITKGLVKLYLQDTLKQPFKYGDYIAISVFSDSNSNTNNLYIETLEKDFKLYRNTVNYQWFKFDGKKIIIFCGFDSTEKCKKYYEGLKFKKINNTCVKLLDKKVNSYELDGKSKLWNIRLNKEYQITDINGKIIEAEIANPKAFKNFLKIYSLLKLYQLNKDGPIVFPR